MNKTQHFDLINGTFTPEEARQVLGTMVKNKIAYHSLESHSDSEISGGSKLHSKERLHSLRELNESLKELFETASAQNKSLKIRGRIEIDFVE